MSSQVTLSKITQGANGVVAVTPSNLLAPYTITISPDATLSFTPGTVEAQLTLYGEIQLTIPPNGTDSIDLTTGLITGSQSLTIVNSDNSGALVFTTGVKYIETVLTPGASGISLFPGASNGWLGPLNAVSDSISVRGSTSTGLGGNYREVCGDSIGFTVNSTHKVLCIENTDGSHTATVNLYLGGN
jgi:hypothetical protein